MREEHAECYVIGYQISTLGEESVLLRSVAR